MGVRFKTSTSKTREIYIHDDMLSLFAVIIPPPPHTHQQSSLFIVLELMHICSMCDTGEARSRLRTNNICVEEGVGEVNCYEILYHRHDIEYRKHEKIKIKSRHKLKLYWEYSFASLPLTYPTIFHFDQINSSFLHQKSILIEAAFHSKNM